MGFSQGQSQYNIMGNVIENIIIIAFHFHYINHREINLKFMKMSWLFTAAATTFTWSTGTAQHSRKSASPWNRFSPVCFFGIILREKRNIKRNNTKHNKLIEEKYIKQLADGFKYLPIYEINIILIGFDWNIELFNISDWENGWVSLVVGVARVLWSVWISIWCWMKVWNISHALKKSENSRRKSRRQEQPIRISGWRLQKSFCGISSISARLRIGYRKGKPKTFS